MKKRILLLLALFVIPIVSFSSEANAAPGDLDISFSQDGKLFDFLLHGGSDYIYGTAIQTDGKIVAVGQATFGNVRSCGVSRYNTDGTLDATFDGDGRTVIPSGRAISGEFICADVAIQADGKIVAVGRTGNFNTQDFVVVRYNTDGAFDTSFDSDGIVITSLGAGDDVANAVVIQADGKIVVAGNSSELFAVARYNADGSLDTSFDSDGIVTTSVSGFGAGAYAVAIQADGKIVAVGGVSHVSGGFAFVRYNMNGSLDTSFDTDGKVLISVEIASTARAVAIQADGKIVAAGRCRVTTGPGFPPQQNEEFALVRVNTDGSLDTSFDSDGKVITTMSATNESANAIAIQTDGKIVIAGYTRDMSPQDDEDFALVRFNTDGSLDTSFDSDGMVFTPLGEGDDAANAMAIQSDGKIVAAGYTNQSSSSDDFGVVRYNTDGSLDVLFSSDGMTNNDVGFRQSFGRAVAMQPNGKIVVAGFTQQPDQVDRDFAVFRYNADGSLDTSFDSDGKVITPLLPGANEARAVAVQADGKIVVVGTAGLPFSQPLSTDAAVVRYNTDGSLDTTFDSDGKVIADFGVFDTATGVAIQADGKIVVSAAVATFGNPFGMLLIRFNTDGSLDTSFDSDGTVTPVGLDFDRALAVAIQPDGKIVAVGRAYNGTNVDFAVIRHNTDGSPDTAFDMDGKVTTAVLNADDLANAVAIQPDGKIVVAGLSNNGADNDFAVVRYNPNGSLDTSFDSDGKLTTPVLLDDQANAIAIQANGKILAAGTSNNSSIVNVTNANEFAMVRYNTDGSLDTTFNADGKLVFDFWGTSDDRLFGMALDANGRVVVAGEASNNFAVARVLGDFVPNAEAPFDFDGDGKTDVAIFRAAGGEWWWRRSSDGVVPAVQFGLSSDVIAPGDFTGDGKLDIAFFRPSDGFWNILRSEDFSYYAFPFGVAGDVPATGDYDGDGKADVAVFRGGTWYIGRSSDGGTTITGFGVAGDVPVTADYDGDGKDDIAIYRPNGAGGGEWWINRSTAGLLAMQFGAATDKTVPGDYTGDGKADIAFWRPSTGEWYIVRSENLSYYAFPFGQNGDVPAPGDYDGDGKMDAAIFRPSQAATWYIAGSTSGTQIVGFGVTGDRPVPNSFVR